MATILSRETGVNAGDGRIGRPARIGAPDVCAAVALVLLLWSLAVVLTLNFRPLYYIYMWATGLPDTVGLPADEIAANYEALIGYNSIFFPGPLRFPTLALSEHGRIHYEEVKRIFAVFQYALLVSAAGTGIAAWFGVVLPLRRRARASGPADPSAPGRAPRTGFLKAGGIATLASAVGILLYLGLDWERFFVRFHETFFDNDYWIFDEAADPSILILPNGYFLACAVMIFALVTALSIAAILAARRISARTK